MPDTGSRIQRIHNQTTEITKQNASMREVIAKSLEVLNIPLPDTFLGRKTHEPFPFAEEAEPVQPSATGDGLDGSGPDGSTGRPPRDELKPRSVAPGRQFGFPDDALLPVICPTCQTPHAALVARDNCCAGFPETGQGIQAGSVIS